MRNRLIKQHARTRKAAFIIAEQIERRLLFSTYTVNTLSDAVSPGAGLLTFRQAVADANSHSGADTIAFAPAVFSVGKQHTITLTQGQINFTDTSGATAVTGPGSNVAAINAGGLSRLFGIVPNAIVSISGLTLTGGKQTTADSNENTEGGAIFNAGILTIANSTVSGNGVAASASYEYGLEDTAGIAMGGAIYSTGPLTITGSLLSDNSVTNSGGAIGNSPDSSGGSYGGAIYTTGPLFVMNDSVSANSATGSSTSDDRSSDRLDGGPAAGGGIYVSATATVLNSIISGNTATGLGPRSYGSPHGSDADGGGIFAGGSLTMTNSTVSGNNLNASPSSYDGGFSGATQGGGIYVGGAATISGTTISNNISIAGNTDFADKPSAGGGVFAAADAVLSMDRIDGNSLQGGPGGLPNDLTTAGGGVYGAGNLTIQNTSVSNNQVSSQIPEDVSERRVGGFNVGGGIVITAASTITGSTIAGNSVTGGQGPNAYSHYQSDAGGDGDGGGVYSSAPLTITNTTIANNDATGGAGGEGNYDSAASNGANGNGGAVYTTGDLNVFDSTISGNASTAGGGLSYTNPYGEVYPAGAAGSASGGGVDISAGSTVLDNSIISANTAAGVFSDMVGSANSTSASNRIGVGGGLTNGLQGNQVGIDNAELSLLGNYGGFTQTMVPLTGSPVIDAGNNNLIPSGITTDQRGFARISGNAVDIGADELGNSSIAGTVFNDANGDHVQDNRETGRAGITVYDDANNNGQLDPGELTTTTDANGHYLFTQLNPGNFKIRQLVPSGWKQTTPANGFGWTVTVANNQASTGNNFGEQLTGGSIAGTVFNDANGNGVQNAGETGIAGTTIYDDANNNGKLDAGELSTTTDADGDYLLNGLPAGNYKIREIVPTGRKQTTPSNGYGYTLALAGNQSLIGKNFGEQVISTTPTAGSISGVVFDDANDNSKQDAGEMGLGGWTVYIDANNDGILDNGEISTVTQANGSYSFLGLSAGNYLIRAIRPAGWSQTTPASGFGQHIALAKNQTLTGIQFGERQIT